MNLTTNRSQGSQETNHGVQLAIEVSCMWKQLEKTKQKKNTTFACKLKLLLSSRPWEKIMTILKRVTHFLRKHFPSVNPRLFCMKK